MKTIEMRILFYLLLTVTVTQISGCVMIGDGVLNATTRSVNVKVTFRDGKSNEVCLPGKQIWSYERSSRILSVEAFTLSGKRIGEFNQSDVPKSRKTYGKYILYGVFEDGVFPIPERCLKESNHLDEGQIKGILAKERARENRLK